MSGIRRDPITAAAVVAPGNGNKHPAPLDRQFNLYVADVFYYDQFRNRRQLGADTGANPTTLTASTTLTAANASGTYILNNSLAQVVLTLPSPSAATTQGKIITVISVQAGTGADPSNKIVGSLFTNAAKAAGFANGTATSVNNPYTKLVASGNQWLVLENVGWSYP